MQAKEAGSAACERRRLRPALLRPALLHAAAGLLQWLLSCYMLRRAQAK